MTPEEFKSQIFKTKDQWEKGGLPYRLEMLKDGGITLYSTPAFTQIQRVDGVGHPDGLAVDACGQIYFIDRKTRRIYRYDPGTQRLEQISSMSNCSSDSKKEGYTRILIDRFTLWVLDRENHRVLAFSRENFQIKYAVDNLKEPVDIGVDEQGYLYVLDKEENQVFKIFTYDINGTIIEKPFDKSCLKEPIWLAVGKENNLYVIDRGYTGFLRFTQQGECSGPIGDFTSIPGDSQSSTITIEPSLITIDKEGNIFAVDEKTGLICQFDSDGSSIGKIQIPGFTDPIRGLALDSKGNLYASSSKGIALLSTGQMFTKEKGFYYSKTLDSGIQNCQWHRLAFNVDIPPKTILEVYYYSSDDSALKRTIDEVLSDQNKSTQEKANFVDNEIGTWIGPEKNPNDMLFRRKTGRYLWLKLALSTFDEKVRPAITQMRVYYPRISYLRYLPATYQEDPAGRDFLERFLPIFETVFYDLETEITHIFKYFDPDTVPQNFLAWLASWLNLALEEDWPEAKKRQFIKQASALYKRKGTPAGIEELIKLYTDKTPLILEHSRTGKPMVLGGNFRLGINSLLIQTPVRGFRLGDDSILGRVALRDVLQAPEDPFLPMAHRFTIVLDLSPEEVTRYEKGLKRIIDEEKPAHTAYNLRIIKEMRIGMGTYVGISTRVADYQPIHLGVDSTVGSGIVVMGGEKGGRVEQHSRVEKDTELI